MLHTFLSVLAVIPLSVLASPTFWGPPPCPSEEPSTQNISTANSFTSTFGRPFPSSSIKPPAPQSTSTPQNFSTSSSPSSTFGVPIPRPSSSGSPQSNSTSKYRIIDNYDKDTFFDGFTFFNAPDPTNGNVDFVDGDEAFASGLAQVQNDGTIVLAVDSTTQLTPGQNRKSVRVTSNKSYNSGTLFIADIFAMPHGCAVWPAYWMVGPNWPNGGEVDILEGVNDQTTNQITAHTGTNCHVNGGVQTLGKLLGGACQSANGVNAGCAFSLPDTSSYGHQFNLQSGGVYAHTWEPDAIKVYFFSRGAIPQDILDGKPDPDSWGTPAALFTDDTGCNIEDSFKDHSIVFDITLCGDWAGSAYGSMGCPGTCQQQVADPTNFQLAQFKISSVKVYGHN